MLLLRQPNDDDLRSLLASQADQPFSYPDVGLTRTMPLTSTVPPARKGWNIDHHRVLLGYGRDAFEAAKGAIRRWEMFPKEVAQVCWPDTPIQEGKLVAVLYRAWPLLCWMVFPCRVVYAMDEVAESASGRIHRFGFAYGTLPDHPERGEERFLVEWNEADDSVWYDLLPVSQPAHWIARLGYPYTRWEQARFRRLSGEAMQRAVKATAGAYTGAVTT